MCRQVFRMIPLVPGGPDCRKTDDNFGNLDLHASTTIDAYQLFNSFLLFNVNDPVFPSLLKDIEFLFSKVFLLKIF
jgi:hypothetical protein